jgi:hypothetical protein
MRESALTARRDEHGVEVLVVHRPITFSLEQTARAMHAVLDPHLLRLNARPMVGRSRVREVLRQIVTDGWPPDFSPDPARVAYWQQWLLDRAVFTDKPKR